MASRRPRKQPASGAKPRRAPTLKKTKSVMPRRIFAQASPLSVGGMSMFEAGFQINAETVANFSSEHAVIHRAVEKLQHAGFEVLQVTESTINIAGSPNTYEEAFNTRLIAEEREVIKEFGKSDEATFIDCPGTDVPGLITTSRPPPARIRQARPVQPAMRRRWSAPGFSDERLIHAPSRDDGRRKSQETLCVIPPEVLKACESDRSGRLLLF